MKWIKASERLPEETLAKTYVGKNQYGAYDLFMWDNMMKFFRPYQHEYGEMIEWLDESPSGEQGEQGELYRLIKHVAECAFNSRVQIEGSAGFEVWWQEELKMNRKLREIESKLSSPPPEGQDELWDIVADKFQSWIDNDYDERAASDVVEQELSPNYLLIKK